MTMDNPLHPEEIVKDALIDGARLTVTQPGSIFFKNVKWKK